MCDDFMCTTKAMRSCEDEKHILESGIKIIEEAQDK